MVDPAAATAAAAVVAEPMINWSINVWDLLMIGVAAVVLYSRLTTLETKIGPLWEWWNSDDRRVTQDRRAVHGVHHE